jgi:hypothetical protein
MGVTITRRGRPPRFDANRIATIIKGVVPGMILERTNRGVDINGQQFAAYSRRYRNRLRRMGEDPKVDLRLSGGLLNSVKARGATLRADSVEVTIAPDTGTSPVWAPKAGGKSRRTGKQSPPHNVVGYWLHYGTKTIKPRPWMGLTPQQYAELVREIARICWR